MEEYLAWDAPSGSRLEDMRKSPLYCRYRIDNPEEESRALVVGSALHTALLEPHLFDGQYCQRPPGHGGSNAFKEAKALLEEQGFILLSDDEWQMVHGIVESARRHATAKLVMDAMVGIEVSAIAAMQGTCVKIRPDIVCERAGLRFLVNLKTAISAAPRDFERAVYNFGYHRSAALVMDAFDALKKPADHHLFLVCEKEPPYQVAVYDIDEPSLTVGRDDYKAALARYVECEQSGEWPSYNEEIQPIGLPAWAFRRWGEDA